MFLYQGLRDICNILKRTSTQHSTGEAAFNSVPRRVLDACHCSSRTNVEDGVQRSEDGKGRCNVTELNPFEWETVSHICSCWVNGWDFICILLCSQGCLPRVMYVGIIVINGLGNGKWVIMTIIKCIAQIRDSYNNCGNVRRKTRDNGNNRNGRVNSGYCYPFNQSGINNENITF